MEHPQRRLLVSFSIVLPLHVLFLLMLGVNIKKAEDELRIISNVELLEPAQEAVDRVAPPATLRDMIAQVFTPAREASAPRGDIYDLQAAPARPAPAEQTPPAEAPINLDREELVRVRNQKIDELVNLSGGDRARAKDILDTERNYGAQSSRTAPPALVDKTPLVETVGARRAPVSLPDAAPARPRARTDGIADTVPQRQKAREIAALQKTIAELPRSGSAAPLSSGRAGNRDYIAQGRPSSGIQMARTMPVLPRRETVIPVTLENKTRAAQTKIAEIKKEPVDISGPLEKRKIIAASMPPYPEWAKQQNIEANVVLKFFVDPDGRVLPNLFITQTSGYAALDQVCKDYLLRWVFAPLAAGEPQSEQWGVITMRFRLQ